MSGPVVKAIGFTLAFLSAGVASAQKRQPPARLETPSVAASNRASREDPGVRAYCEATVAARESESALLSSPWVFGNAGTLLGTEDASLSTAETRTGWPRLRIQAGVGLSPTRMRRGGLLRDFGKAECRRFAAQRELEKLSEALWRGGRAALEAKAEVLAAAIGKGQALVQEIEQKLDASLATVDDYRALIHRVSALELELFETREAIAELPRARGGTEQWGQARRAAELAEWETSRSQAALRESEAFEIELRGGYDNVIDVAQRLPMFGNLTMRFSPGYFWQERADRRAAQAHLEFQRQKLFDHALDSRGLEERLKLTEAREGELARVIARLTARLAALREVGGARAELSAGLLELDLAELRADQSFLRARVAELRSALRGLDGRSR